MAAAAAAATEFTPVGSGAESFVGKKRGRRGAVRFVGFLDREACKGFMEAMGAKEQHALTMGKSVVKRARTAGLGDENGRGTGEGESLASEDVLEHKDEGYVPRELADSFPKRALAKLRENAKAMHEARRKPGAADAEPPLDTPLLVPMTTTVARRLDSKDGRTTKLLVRLQDGNLVETVLMRMDALMGAKGKLDDTVRASKEGGHRRITVCVSSQVGCLMGCKFCATGTLGLTGSLRADEILEQVAHAVAICRPADGGVRNVVFMGQGEPLDNYRAVVEACRCLTDTNLFMLRPSSVCVSTVANLPMNIRRLADDVPKVSLAVSLHAPTQDRRLNIVPSARAAHIDKIMDAIAYHVKASGRFPMVEYVLLRGVNDTAEDARLLGELLKSHGWPQAYNREPGKPPPSRDANATAGGGGGGVVNLIPYNPTGVADAYQAPSPEAVEAFADVLCNPPFQVRTTVRREMGQDIEGACGQLSLKVVENADARAVLAAGATLAAAGAGGSSRAPPSDIEDLAARPPKRARPSPSPPSAAPPSGPAARLLASLGRFLFG